jgi:hypothetical protein
MKQRSVFASLVVALVLSAAPVGADTWEAHANICQPDKSDVAFLDYSNTGVFNESTSSSGKLHCPVEYISDLHTGGLNTTTISLNYVDRSSSENVSCTLFINLFDGTPILTATQTSPAGASSSTQISSWVIGSEIGGGRQLVIQCTLPKAASSSTRSGVRGIRLDTNT